MGSVRVGLIGYGYSGKTFHAPLICSTPGLQLACVVSSDSAKVQKDFPGISVFPAWQAARDTADLFVIATPSRSHFEGARAVLEAGKHVVVDKPVTATAAEAQSLIAQAKCAGKLLSVFHNRRWDGDFLTVKRILAEKTLGDVSVFESHFDRYRPEVKKRWRETPGPGSGIWYDLGAHLIDQALQLFGMPLSMYADLEAQRPGAQVTDYFHAVLRYGTARVLLAGSSLVVSKGPRFAIHGTLGSFTKFGMDTQEDSLKNGIPPAGPGWGSDPIEGNLAIARDDAVDVSAIATLPGNYPQFYAGVRDAILSRAANPVTPEEALNVMRVLEAGVQSSRSRCEIALNQCALNPESTVF